MILFRLLGWALRRMGLPTFFTFLLIALAMSSLLSGLAAVIRGFDLTLSIGLVAGGVLLGWNLARTPLPAWLAGLVVLSLGSEAIIIRVGNLTAGLLALLLELLRLVEGRWPNPLATWPDLAPGQAALSQLAGQVTVLGLRVQQWLAGLLGGESVFDPVATTLVWSAALWLVAVWLGWVMRRHARPLLALAPAAALLATVLAHTRLNPAALFTFLLATLLLIALVRQQARERRWQLARISFSSELHLDMAAAIIPIAFGLVAVAWLVTNLSFRPLNNFVKTMLWGHPPLPENQLADSLGLEARAEATTRLDRARRGGLPRLHLLGSGPELSQQVVMLIETDDPPDQPPPRYYWRSLTYDRYTGRGWETQATQPLSYAAGEPTGPAPATPHRLLRQTVEGSTYFNGLLTVAGELVTADQPFQVEWRGPNDIFGATLDSPTYQAESRLPRFSEADLRAAPGLYSEAMQARYLALPRTIPNRVLALARDLTATEATPYDRAKAIESYLRAFPYTLDLPTPPASRDLADYFLFDLQRGYCDYYATSMVVLARAAGLPARLAIGYVSGSYNPTTQRTIISEAEAHSWVEIYFPEIGWVTFEPTGGRPALERPPEISPEVAALDDANPSPNPSPLRGGELLWLTALALGGLLAISGVLFSNAIDTWRLQRLSPTGTLTALQQRLYGHGRRLNTPARPGDTPYEFATALAEQITNLASRSRWREQLSPTGPEVARLTDIYMRALFSPDHANPTDQAAAIALWQRLRRRLWLAWLLTKRPQGF